MNKFIYLSIYLTLRLFRFCRYLHYLERGAAKNRTVPSAFTIARGPCVFVQIRQTFERTIVLDRSGRGTSYTDGAEVESDRTSSLWPQKSAHQLKPSLGRPRLRSDGKTTFNGDFIAARLRKGGKRHEWVYRGEEMACSWRLYK